MTFTQDKSKVIRQMLSDLQNSVITGVLLVAVIILFALGFRASLFIGIAIPASFLAGVLGLQLAGPDRQHRGAVLADPRGRHAGRRRHHRVGVRRAAHGGRHAAEGGLCARRQAHVRPGDRRDRDARRGVLAAAVLAGRGRRVHEISADHADRDAVGVARGGAVLHADARRAARQGFGQAARRTRPRGRPLHADGAAGAAPARRDARLRGAAARGGAGRLRQIRQRRRVLPGGRARLRPGHRSCPRQSLARRKEPLPRRSREARARKPRG